jgi:hypothetical protein
MLKSSENGMQSYLSSDCIRIYPVHSVPEKLVVLLLVLPITFSLGWLTLWAQVQVSAKFTAYMYCKHMNTVHLMYVYIHTLYTHMGLANIFYEGSDNKQFKLCGCDGLNHNPSPFGIGHKKIQDNG